MPSYKFDPETSRAKHVEWAPTVYVGRWVSLGPVPAISVNECSADEEVIEHNLDVESENFRDIQAEKIRDGKHPSAERVYEYTEYVPATALAEALAEIARLRAGGAR